MRRNARRGEIEYEQVCRVFTVWWSLIFRFLVGSESAQAKLAAAKAIALAKAKGGKKKPKSGFTKDLADVSSKNVKKHRYTAHKDRSTETKGRGGIKKPGKQQKGGRSIPKKGGKVTKKGRK